MTAKDDLELVAVEGLVVPARTALGDPVDLLLGRDETCPVRIRSASVSREHARIRSRDGELVIEDLESTLGVLVNEERVTRCGLEAGDRIRIGNATLVVCRAGEAPGSGETREVPDHARSHEGLFRALTALLASEPGDATELLPDMLGELVDAFQADRGFVFAPGADGEMEVVGVAIRPGSVIGEDAPVSRGLVQRIAGEGRPFLLSSLETDALKEEHQSIPGVLCSIVAAPMTVPTGTGALYLDSAIERRRFQDRDQEVLLAFTRAAGDALLRGERHLLECQRSSRMAEVLREELGDTVMLGGSAPMEKVLQEIQKAAETDVTVLVTGESGTGKELAARALHAAGERSRNPLVAVNCAAIPAELVESELFGHEKGAFTGAAERRLGRFELAHGGTLFLDEVGELPLPVQGKLLRALQERTIQRVGGKRPVEVDFRLVCATNVDLEAAVREKRFREDLFYRIAVYRIQLPPLKARGEDVLLLARAFVERFAREFRRRIVDIQPRACELLLDYPWPGNVRELRNVVEQAVVREDSDLLTVASLLPALGRHAEVHLRAPEAGDSSASAMEGYPDRLEEARSLFEKQFLLHKLRELGGNMKATAEALGLSRRHLYAKCDDHGIDYKSFRGSD